MKERVFIGFGDDDMATGFHGPRHSLQGLGDRVGVMDGAFGEDHIEGFGAEGELPRIAADAVSRPRLPQVLQAIAHNIEVNN